MVKGSGFKVKRLSEDDFLLETALHKRALRRLIFAIYFIISGLSSIFFAFLPILGKSTLPLIWIEHANQHGWTEELQEIGIRLLSNGRIEIMPIWASYLMMILGGLFVWIGIKMWQNRYESGFLGDAGSLGYWINFYWLKKPIGSVTVLTNTDARKAKRQVSSPNNVKKTPSHSTDIPPSTVDP